MMDAGVHAEALVLWDYISKKAQEHLTDQYVPVRYELEDGDIINQVEFDCGSVYFYIDGEDDPYEWDNFDENVNSSLMTQSIDWIKTIANLEHI
jgi:hypothetical protein